MMSKSLTTLAASAVLLSSSAAFADFSANMALTTDYVWRGVSQSDNDPAIQGGIDYDFADTGFSIGTWASNVNGFSPDNSLELDVYGGWGTEFDNGLGVSVGYIHYDYPGAGSAANFNEWNLGASYSYFSAMWSHDTTNGWDYIEVGADFEIMEEINLGLHYGNYDLDSAGDYNDWKIGVSKTFGKFDLALDYTDTSGITSTNNNDGRLIFTVSTGF